MLEQCDSHQYVGLFAVLVMSLLKMKDIYFGITLLTDQKKYTSEKKL